MHLRLLVRHLGSAIKKEALIQDQRSWRRHTRSLRKSQVPQDKQLEVWLAFTCYLLEVWELTSWQRDRTKWR